MASRYNSPPYQPYQGYEQHSPPIPQYDEAYFGHRLSNKESSRQHEINSPGLESVMADEGDKEVAPQYYSRPDQMPQRYNHQRGRRDGSRGRRICGLPVFWFCILIAAILSIGAGLGIGLGIGLTKDSSVA